MKNAALTPSLELFEFYEVLDHDDYRLINSHLFCAGMKGVSDEARNIRIDAYRIRYRRAKKEIMGKIVRNCVAGKDMKTVIEHYCTEQNIDERDKFMTIALDELSKLHTGALLGIGVTEEMFEKWEQANQQINGGLK